MDVEKKKRVALEGVRWKMEGGLSKALWEGGNKLSKPKSTSLATSYVLMKYQS